MSRIKLPHIQQFIARGKVHYYFRKPGSKRVRLPGLPGSAEFMTAYQLALDSAPRIEVGAGRTVPGSVNAAAVAYYKSASFKERSPDTQRFRRNVIEKFGARFGDSPIRLLQRPHLTAMAERIEKPFARKNWLKTMRAFLKYAVEIGMRSDNPSLGMKISLPKSDGWSTWSEQEITIFRQP
jgi:hypothetical protein